MAGDRSVTFDAKRAPASWQRTPASYTCHHASAYAVPDLLPVVPRRHRSTAGTGAELDLRKLRPQAHRGILPTAPRRARPLHGPGCHPQRHRPGQLSQRFAATLRRKSVGPADLRSAAPEASSRANRGFAGVKPGFGYPWFSKEIAQPRPPACRSFTHGGQERLRTAWGKRQ